MRVLALLLLGLVFSFTAAARADEPAPDAVKLITQQLEAFARDDAPGAFALAAPPIQEKFGDAATFLAMVKAAYPPIYHHRSVQFGKGTRDGAEMRQGVIFIDDDNNVWDGLYSLVLQADGGWRIVGCVLMKSPDTSL